MGRLNFYTTETNYNTAKNSFKYPTVAYVEESEEVKWMSIRDKYTKEYLTFEALEDGTFTFTMDAKLPTTCVPNIAYSTDNGKTWTTTDNVDNQEVVVTTPTITAGNKVLWKSNAVQFHSNTDQYPGGNRGYGSFNSSGNYNVEGNIMSLLYGDNFNENNTFKEYVSTGYGVGSFAYLFRNNTKLLSNEYLILPATILATYCYAFMFYGCTSLTTAPELPATTLVDYCYSNMFYGCTSLTTAPELPATTLAQYCYNNMFYGCTSLTTAPELPATTLESSCYYDMFYGCTSLTTAPELPATTLATYCYAFMFYGCTSLTTVPELPATTLANNCYNNMFYGCTSLTTAPELPATTLTNSCYGSMFYGCTSLTTAPVLPATTLANYCYQSMFQGCTSLTTAPELPATTLSNNCYNSMFYGCSNLNYIKAMFTTTPSTTYTSSWVQGVAATGTFVKNSAATWDVTGIYGVPTGWTVETAIE